MISTQYTTEDLKKLPLRAIVAFAARCAGGSSPSPNSPRATRNERPVEWPSTTPSGSPRRSPRTRPALPSSRWSGPSRRLEPSRVSRSGASAPRRRPRQPPVRRQPSGSCSTEARTIETPDRWTNTPEARSYLTRLEKDTADIVALDAFTAAVEAADAVAFDDTFMRGAIQDYERLLGLHLGSLSPGRAAYRPLARWAARAALSAADRAPTNSSRESASSATAPRRS